MSDTGTYHLLRLVRNLRTGRNQPVASLNLQLAKIRAARKAGAAGEAAPEQGSPEAAAQEKAESLKDSAEND